MEGGGGGIGWWVWDGEDNRSGGELGDMVNGFMRGDVEMDMFLVIDEEGEPSGRDAFEERIVVGGIDMEDEGAGPCALEEAEGDGGEGRGVVERFVIGAESEGELHGFARPELSDNFGGFRLQGASSDGVARFSRDGEESPFGKGLDREVDNVAWVLGSLPVQNVGHRAELDFLIGMMERTLESCW